MSKLKMSREDYDYEVQFDGGIGPKNPGGVASCAIVVCRKGVAIHCQSRVVGKPPNTSNNLAEYEAVVLGLEYLNEKKGSVIFVGDSQMVCGQMNKLWTGKAAKWKPRPDKIYWPSFEKARRLALRRKEPVRFMWVPREQNSVCDELSRRARQIIK